MSYSELIKNYSRIREYMREFFVYGFKTREEYNKRSARSYDNERRRIESWLADYMSFRQDASGKNMFISVDGRHVPRNPLYIAWKTASFTKNDISLHFLLLDILSAEHPLSIPDILEIIDRDYLPMFSNAEPFDESTVRKKLKEYTELGLVSTEKNGRQLLYRLPDENINLAAWRDAVSFFSEENPAGVVGSYLLDKYNSTQDIFSFKHRYMLFALDNDILLELLSAMNEHRQTELELFTRQKNQLKRTVTLPMKIFISAQGGRQYLAGFHVHTQKLSFYRLDSIQKVKRLEIQPDYEAYTERFREIRSHLWGVATGNDQLEHIEMDLRIAPEDTHIIQRLEREKRCGIVTQLSEAVWRFSADVYNALEILPWLRTFTGRIERLDCSNKIVEERFWSDYMLMTGMYADGGDDGAV